MPSLFDLNAPQNAPTPALQTALANGSPLVWTFDGSWRRRALPGSLRAPVEKKLREFADVARSKSKVVLEGASPTLWREGDRFFLAQSFFDLASTSAAQTVAPERVLPKSAGVVVGPLERPFSQWNSTFEQARAPLSSPRAAPTPTTQPAPARSTHQLTLDALEAQSAARAAFRAGRYAQWQQQDARAKALLELLAQRTRAQ